MPNNPFLDITRNLEEILLEKELKSLLEEKRPLRIKAGFDPTAMDLHLGHTILLNKLRQFQDLGHEVYFLIGDFTAAIGDPSGRNSLRPPLTKAQIATHAESYTAHLFKILDKQRTRLVYNSEWLDELPARQLIEIAGKSSVAQLLERDDFSKRYKNNQYIALHEFLYPLLQGYDSVVLKADIEIGGTDQKFNLLMGRELQKAYQQKPQVVMTLPILEGLDGVNKMSKSLGNTIGIQDTPADMFGKIMSINDQLMWRYYALLADYSEADIVCLQDSVKQGTNPRDLKLALAQMMVTRFYTADEAEKQQANFIKRFQKKEIPEDIPGIKIVVPASGLPLANLLKEAELVSSTSDAIRAAKQGGIYIDGKRALEAKQLILPDETHIYKVGKRRIAKIETLAG